MGQIIEMEDIHNLENTNFKTMDRRFRKSFGNANRSVTDKYWSILFLIVLTIWVISCHYASHHHRPESEIDSANLTSPMNTSAELTPFFLWGDFNYLFDTFTYNSVFLNHHYEEGDAGTIWIMTIIYILLITYSLLSLSSHSIAYYRHQLDMACLVLILFTLLHHILQFMIKYSVLTTICDNKSYLRLMPIIIVIMIWYTNKCHTDRYLPKNQSNRLIYFRQFNRLLVPFSMIPLLVYAVLIILTAKVVYRIGTHSILSYLIVGGSCYIGLTFFYFWLMVIYCTVDMEMDDKYITNRLRLHILKRLLKAIAIVSRYHIGTACYHATLIFPRWESSRVIHEPQFEPKLEPGDMSDEYEYKEEIRGIIIHRFCLVQFELHNLTLMSTAVSGTSHLESVRELLSWHISSGVTPSFYDFQGFSEVARSLTIFTMSTNSLITILLWVDGQDNPYLTLSTWLFYLSLMITLNITMKVWDAVLDATLLHSKHAPLECADLIACTLSSKPDLEPDAEIFEL